MGDGSGFSRSTRPGGLAVVEAGSTPDPAAAFGYAPGELLKLLEGLEVQKREQVEGADDWGPERIPLMRCVARKPAGQGLQERCRTSARIATGLPMLATVIHSDPDILGGTPVFVGTRVPFRNLIDYLERNHSLDEFLDSFPSVSREQAVAALEAAHEAVSAGARSSR